MDIRENKGMKIGLSVVLLVILAFAGRWSLGLFIPSFIQSYLQGNMLIIAQTTVYVVFIILLAVCYIRFVEKEPLQVLLIILMSAVTEAINYVVWKWVSYFLSMCNLFDIMRVTQIITYIIIYIIWAITIIYFHRNHGRLKSLIKEKSEVILVWIFLILVVVFSEILHLTFIAAAVAVALIILVIVLWYTLGSDNEKLKCATGKENTIVKMIVSRIFASLVLMGIVVVLCVACEKTPSSSGKWDSLSKEEQQWYERNYGNGKSEAIDKAISDY